MKVLLKKLKNASKGMKFFYFLTLLLYFISYGFFCYSILKLQGIETFIRILLLILFAIYGLIYLIIGLTTTIERKKKVFIPLTIFALLFAICFGVSSYYINRIYNVIDNFSNNKDTSTYKTVLLTKKNHTFSSDDVIGMVNNETNRENYILPKEMIEKENIKNKIEYYDDLNILVAALYSDEVDAIFISKDYPILLGNDEKYQNIVNETEVVKSYSKEMKTEESDMTTTKNLTEPFTVLVLGVDSENTEELDPNAAFNGDTLMLITFNPKTLNATVFSIPRDMYVPISCNNNRYNKVNAAAYGGTSCVVNTIEQLTDIDIDYFVKVDFKAVVDLVDAMDGIDVFVEPPTYDYYIESYGGRLCEQDSLRRFGEHLICMDTGMQHLNGEQALAYARNRHGYLESDIDRNRHQQQVIEAMAKKLITTASFSDFEKYLDTISKHIATNMKTTQILSFYQTIKNMLGSVLSGGDFITITKTYLTYYNLNVNLGGYEVSALGYYEGSLDAITKAMKENLELAKVETIKTVSYDYTSDYERTSEVIGKGIYTGSKLSFMPNFVGDSVSSAKSFANNNNLTLNIEYLNDSNQMDGIILRQSVSAGTMVKNISGFTIYVNKVDKSLDSTTDNKNDNDDEEKTDKDDDNSSSSNSNNSSTNNNSSSSSNNNNNSTNNNNNDNDEEETQTPSTPSIPNNTTPNTDVVGSDDATTDNSNSNTDENIPGNPVIEEDS